MFALGKILELLLISADHRARWPLCNQVRTSFLRPRPCLFFPRTLSTTCDITTWVNDLMNALILLATFFSLFFFLNVGCENGSTQLKKLFLNNIGRKEEKNQREVTLVKCHKLWSSCVPLFLRLEAESFYVHFFSLLLQKRLLYFTNHKLEQILQVQNRLLSTCS